MNLTQGENRFIAQLGDGVGQPQCVL